MNWLLTILAVVGWVVALVATLALSARARRHGIQLGLRLRSNLRPYLLRRAMEAGIDAPEPQPEQVSSLEQVVDDLCTVTRRLVDHERSQMELGDTMNIATSKTQPMDTGEVLEKHDEQGQ